MQFPAIHPRSSFLGGSSAAVDDVFEGKFQSRDFGGALLKKFAPQYARRHNANHNDSIGE